MIKVNVHEAKTNLSRLLLRVAAGEEVVVSKSGKPIARIVAFSESHKSRPLGLDEGLFDVPEDFNAPLPEDLLAAFEARVVENQKQ
jgi:prevent-host-death family protein